MSVPPTDTTVLLKRALAAIDRLEGELETLRRRAAEPIAAEPIAVVGIGCRFPGGAEGPEGFWRLLDDGVDAVGEVPAARWDAAALYDPDPDRAGRITTRRGGFLGPVDGFDAAFFGIAPREAASIDPQQRLLLEVTWEALEHAGIDPARLAGSRTGVFVGICGHDYGQMLAGHGLEAIDTYYAAGNVHSVASGRLSYVLGLTGPSLSVDTACSSSLVAVHLACQSLRNGEADAALAAGVNLILSPTYTVNFSRARMLAADGRCKAFDASADGYGRAEGCGVVVLKRLSDARRVGDRVLAVIRGSAVNQDGASSGLTVPNGPAQQAVVRAALAGAGVTAEAVGYIEAHGTGTSLGDPIEMGALGAVFAASHSVAEPLWVGSAKTNIGHAEGAAGVAGLIKAVLAVRHGRIPPHLHLHTPNPHIDWAGGALAVPTAAQPWPAGRPCAGVSSFGFSGTNAHVIVGPAPEEDAVAEAPPSRGVPVLALSARTPEAAAALAVRHAARLAELPTGAWADACRTAAQGRRAFGQRIAVAAADAGEAAALLAGAVPVAAGDGRVAFLFTGQGVPSPGAGRELYAAEPVFRAAVERCASAFDARLPVPLVEAMFGADAARHLESGTLAQPAQFALQVGLVELWGSWGIVPSVVLGHSLGEYAAAWTAGVMGLEDAARLVAARGRLSDGLPPGGIMAAVSAPAERVAAALAAHGRAVSIAAYNGPSALVLSGEAAAVTAVLAELLAEGFGGDRLAVGHASHSPLMEPMLDAFAREVAAVRLSPPKTAYVSGLLGRPAGAELTDPGYWVRQIREPVRFAEAFARLGIGLGIEVGQRPVLAKLGQRLAPDGAWLSSLHPDRPEARSLAEAAAALWAHGAPLDWVALQGSLRRRADLPTYPWQRTRFWIDPPARRAVPSAQEERAAEVGGLYDHLVGLLDGLIAYGEAHPEVDLHLTYAPFPAPVPGFSWIMTVREPAARRGHFDRMMDAQREMRRLLFRRVDFARCRSVLDFGCGYGGDLVALARRHPGLRLTGQTVSPRQAGVAQAAALRHGVADRVEVFVRDSAHQGDGRYDLVFGFEVAHHIADKAALFARLGRQLNPGGHLVLADFIGEGGVAIDDAPTLSGFLTREGWVDRLSENGLAVVECIDVSAEVANFLDDPGLEAHLEALDRPDLDAAANAAARQAFRGFVRLGALLRRGLARYVLLVAQKRPNAPAGALRAACEAGLARLIPYRLASPEGWVYEPAWRPAGGGPLAAPADVAAVLAGQPAESGLDGLAGLASGLDRLAAGYAAAALAAVAADAVAERHRRLHRRLAGIAVHAPAEPVRTLRDALAVRFPQGAAELALLERCGEGLPAVLRGAADPLDLLFAGGDAGELAHLYGEAPTARAMNALLADAVRAALAERGGGTALRVLEVGAGTGATTAALLPALPPDTAEYLFTDVAPTLLARSRERFAATPFLRTAVFDVEQDPAGQGLAEARFDLIVAANVLHATRDVAAALGHLHGLLAPGGLLVLLEGTRPAAWVDLTFGLTDGWWRFADTGRRADHPLLDAAGWRRALDAAGFEGAAALTLPDGTPTLFEQAVILARRPAAVTDAGRWLVLGNSEAAAALATRLTDGGAAVTRDAEAAVVPGWAGIVDLRALDAGDGADGALRAAADATALLRTLCAAGSPGPLWLVTRGAVAVQPGDPVPGAAQAGLWGLGLVAGLEHPDLACRLVDLDPEDGDPATLLAAVALADREDRTAWRRGRRLAARLAPGRWPVPAAPVPVHGEASYLILGGFGGLGLAVAGWLAERGARTLVLAGRSGPRPVAEPALAALAARGVRVVRRRVDAADAAAVAALVAEADGLAPLRGVIQAAGVLDDGALVHLDGERLRRVMAPKVVGAWALHEATAGLPLDWFVLFASAAGVIGNAGQANHAAANAALDALAHHRRALGLPALSIDWGQWAEVGSAAGRTIAMPGVAAFSPAEGLAAFARLVGEGAVQAAVLPADWAAFTAPRAAGRPMPLFEELAPAAAAASPAVVAAATGGDVRDRVAALAAEVMGFAGGLPDGERPLAAYGFDSLMAISLRNRIRGVFGVDVPMVDLLEGAGVGTLAAAVAARLPENGPPAAAASAEVDAAVGALSDDEVEAELRRLMAETEEAMLP